MLVVDDGSDDETLSIAEGLALTDARVRVFTQPNAGVSVARNTAMAAARGSFFVLLDADDELAPTYLESQRAFIDAHPGHGIYSTNAWVVQPGGSRRLFWNGRDNRVYSLTLAEELRRNRINVHSTFPREVYETIGGFAPGYRSQDYEFWLRAMIEGYTHIMNPEPLVMYNVLDGSLSTDRVLVVGNIVEFIELLSHEAPMGTGPQFIAALELWRARLRIAQMEERLLAGDPVGARRVFFQNARHLPDWRKIPVGGALIALSPRLYRRVLLGRLDRSRKMAASR